MQRSTWNPSNQLFERASGNEQLERFPKRDELKSVFVKGVRDVGD